MKLYSVYVNGEELPDVYIKAGSHNQAEKKAQKRFPQDHVIVVYTEISAEAQARILR